MKCTVHIVHQPRRIYSRANGCCWCSMHAQSDFYKLSWLYGREELLYSVWYIFYIILMWIHITFIAFDCMRIICIFVWLFVIMWHEFCVSEIASILWSLPQLQQISTHTNFFFAKNTVERACTSWQLIRCSFHVDFWRIYADGKRFLHSMWSIRATREREGGVSKEDGHGVGMNGRITGTSEQA